MLTAAQWLLPLGVARGSLRTVAPAGSTVCPSSGFDRIAVIVYGLPACIDLTAIGSGRIVMGGCILRGNDP